MQDVIPKNYDDPDVQSYIWNNSDKFSRRERSIVLRIDALLKVKHTYEQMLGSNNPVEEAETQTVLDTVEAMIENLKMRQCFLENLTYISICAGKSGCFDGEDSAQVRERMMDLAQEFTRQYREQELRQWSGDEDPEWIDTIDNFFEQKMLDHR